MSLKKTKGQVWTPPSIVQEILDCAGYKTHHILGKKILDPACGNGRFLVEIVRRIIEYSSPKDLPANLKCVYGWDIDAKLVEQARNNLNCLLKSRNIDIEVDWNLEVCNSLHRKDIFYQNSFDFIVGNPPYIRTQNLDKRTRDFLNKHYQFCQYGATDIYIAFYELAIHLLSEDGICAFITPNTFLYTNNGKFLRKHFITKQNLIQITDFDDIQIFNNVLTYPAIVVFGKKKRAFFTYKKKDTSTVLKKVFYDSINATSSWLLIPANRQEIFVSNFGEEVVRLGDIAQIHAGIQTSADHVFILNLLEKGDDFCLLQNKKNKQEYVEIETNILKPIIKASRVKRGEEIKYEYIIFPYKKDENGQYVIIPEDEIREKYPLAYQYLCQKRGVLDKRDRGKPNPIAWYAFGRSQNLGIAFRDKILFPPISIEPNFVYVPDKEATFYAGFCIIFDGDYDFLLEQLNSERMKRYIAARSRSFRGGWKAYNKTIVSEFPIVYRYK